MFSKSDQEPAIVSLRDLVQQVLGSAVEVTGKPRQGLGFEESAVGESKSNGAAENGVQQIQGHIRVIRDGLEERYQQKIEGNHAALPWLIRHAAGVMSRLMVGDDGKTGYERLKGKRFRGEWVEFGECIWYLRPRSLGRYKLDSRWESGV